MSAKTAKRVERQIEELLDLVLGRGQATLHLVLSRRLSTGLYRSVAGGVPPVQLQALAVLASGDMRMRELAHRLGLATSTVTRLVDRLEAAGLAERRSQRPDRRSIVVGLSTAGRDTLAAVRSRLRRLLHDLLAGLAPTEQAEFVRLVTKLGESLTPPALAPAAIPSRVG